MNPRRMGIGLACSCCSLRGMERVGERLYRCVRPDCASRGDVRMLTVWGGHILLLAPSTALALDSARATWGYRV